MSYADDRDEIAELFGAAPKPKKQGYSEELATDRPDQRQPHPAPRQETPKAPVKMRPPAESPPPQRPATAPPASPVKQPAPPIEDEEFLGYNEDVPDFSGSEFGGTKPAPAQTAEQQAPAAQPPVEQRVPRQAPPAQETGAPPAASPPQRRKEQPAPQRGRRVTVTEEQKQFTSEAVDDSRADEKKLLDTNGLVKIYDGRTVVNGVAINVRPGEIVGLLGPNGAGKTTSFYMIVGLVPPNGGQVLFDGNDVTSMPMYKRARLGMGYLPQEESIFRKLTVEQNIMAVMETMKLSRKEKKARCNELLERFSITHIRKNIALTCSGGEKRRLTIARSLVTEPSLLMLDEPFSGVDPIAVNEIQGIVEDLRKSGLAILITDHNARQTLELVDRAYLIYEGKVLREGSRDFLINDPVSRELYLGDRFTM